MTSLASIPEPVVNESVISRSSFSVDSIKTSNYMNFEHEATVSETNVLSDVTIGLSSSDLHCGFVRNTDVEEELNQTVIVHPLSDDFSDSATLSSPQKRHLRYKSKTDLKPKKMPRILEYGQNDCLKEDVILSGRKVKLNISSASKRGRKRISELQRTGICIDLDMEPANDGMEVSLLDLKLEENLMLPKNSEEVFSDLEPIKESSEKTESNLSPMKKARNPYGRKGKPAGVDLPALNQSVKANCLSTVSHTRVKVDYSKPDWINPEWLKPFQEGWRREIVYRNAGLSSTSGRKCDIYYFTPDNQKLRSTPEINSYLSSLITELTILSFTFVKHRIYKEPAEFVRNAAISGKRGGLSVLLPKVPKSGNKAKSLDSALKKPGIRLKLKCTNSQIEDEIITKNTAGNFLDISETNKDQPKLFLSEDIHRIITKEGILSQENVRDISSCMDIDADLSKGIVLSDSVASVDAVIQKFPNPSLSLIKNSKSLKWKPKKPKKLKRLIKLKRLNKALLKLPPVCKDIGTENADVCGTENAGACSPMLVEEDLSNNVSQHVGNDEIARDVEIVPENTDFHAEEELNKPVLANSLTNRDQNAEEESQVVSLFPLMIPNRLDDRKLNIKKTFADKHVVKKSTVCKSKHSVNYSHIRLRMSYRDGLPSKNLVGPKNSSSMYELDQNSVSCASSYPVSNARPCGLHCVGQFGMTPSLHCDVCMCMFHPECVGVSYIPHRTSFTCKTCCTASEDIDDSADVEDMLESSFASSKSSIDKNNAGFNDFWQKSNNSVQSFISPRTFSLFRDCNNVTDRSSERVDNVVLLNAVNKEKPSGRVLTLPLNMVSLLDLSKPIKLSISGRKFIVPTNCHLITENGLRIFLPHDIFSVAPRQRTVTLGTVMSSRQTFGYNFSQPVTVPTKANNSSQNSLLNSSNESYENRADIISDRISCNVGDGKNDELVKYAEGEHKNNVKTEKSQTSVHTMGRTFDVEAASLEDSGQNFVCLTMKADILLRIFNFLNPVNLLKVSKVCALWKQVAETASLWKRVKFDDVAVHNWELAASCLTKNKTTYLDLSRLIHSGSENQTWHQLTGIFSNLTTICHLVFGPCPPNLLYCVASKMASLESLKAVQIIDTLNDIHTSNKRLINTKLDIGKVAILKNLVKLELRGLHGLTLPSHSFTCGLSELRHLSELRYLSLTSLRDIAGDQFDFFGYLKKLEVLEIGDCRLWNKKTYMQLSHLKCLQRLRLENGIESSDDCLGNVLLNLTRLEHLELFCFIMSEQSAEFLATMSHFKRLSLSVEASEMVSYSNSYLLRSIQRMTFLEKLSWNVIGSDLQSDTQKLAPSSFETDALKERSFEVERQQDIEWKSLAVIETILKKSLASTAIYMTKS